MRIIDARTFRPDRPWAALDIAVIGGATVRLHWTDRPYRWHVNDGEEVFVVLDGTVDMQVRRNGVVESHRLTPGTVFYAGPGDAHVAHPVGAARILVIETAGSV